MKLTKLHHWYSGPKSSPFWDVVNVLPKASDREHLYVLGCAVQDIEARLLSELERVKAGTVASRWKRHP